MVSIEYLAGFIDGEGHVSLGKIPRRRQSTEYPVRLVVYNSDLGVLTEIQGRWGGTLSDSGSRNPRWKRGYALIWTNAAAAKVLIAVAPYLRVKWRQAQEVLAYYEHVRKCGRVRDQSGRLQPLSEQELRFREACHLRVKSLNARGPPALAPLVSASSESVLKRNELRNLSSEYLAGLIDAEGSVMIAKWKGRRYPNPHYRPRVTLSNTFRPVLEDVKHFYGGIMADQPPREPTWKHSYLLVWSAGMADQLLASIIPHLRIKQRQAAIVRELISHIKTTRLSRQGRNGRAFVPHPADVVAFRENLYRRIRRLNARGAPAISPTQSEQLSR